MRLPVIVDVNPDREALAWGQDFLTRIDSPGVGCCGPDIEGGGRVMGSLLPHDGNELSFHSGEYVLLTGQEEVPPALARALRAGVEVRRCPGPSEIYCPAVHGRRCLLREGAKAAVVFLAGEHEFFLSGRWQCVTAGISPAVAVLQGAAQPPRARGGFAVVGGEAGVLGVLEALAALVDNPDT